MLFSEPKPYITVLIIYELKTEGMKGLRFILYIVLSAFIFVGCEDDDNDDFLNERSKYEVEFTFFWSSTNFPTDYPSNAHFSKLIGWSHKPASDLFKVGTAATSGIEAMAETGATTPLDSELRERIGLGQGLNLVIADALGSGTGTIKTEVIIDRLNSNVTFVTMVAPSPDWYVGAINVSLLDGQNFVSTKTVNAFVYDSGTDDGTTFTSLDANTSPQGKISLFVDPPLGDGTTVTPVFATVKFTRIN